MYTRDKQGLAIIESNNDKIEGLYHGTSGGIRFVSQQKNGRQSLSITSANGAPIFVAEKPQDSSVMVMSLGNTKLVSEANHPAENGRRYPDYVVPQAFHNHLPHVLRQKEIPRAVMQYFDGRSANVTRQRAVEDLVSRGDADLIVEAAKALGRAGVMGYENPAALQFYVLAMRLDKIKEQVRMRTQAMDVKKVNNFGRPVLQAAEPHYRSFPRPLPHALNNKPYSGNIQKRQTCSECTTGRCPYYGDRSNECLGMCGKECTCWSWLCGDCCVHQGCLEHDQCCNEEGFWSLGCLFAAPFSFSCTSYSC